MATQRSGAVRGGDRPTDSPVAPRAPAGQTVPGFECDLVIPVLNEESRLGDAVVALHEAAEAAALRVRFIVVDNGCTDGTAEVVDRIRGRRVSVDLVSCQTRGKGAAVRAGVRHASAPFVGYCDADRSTPASALVEGIALLRSGFDVVVGSRRCAGAGYAVEQPAVRRLGSHAFHALASRLTGPISDTQCGFKLFAGPVGKALFEATSLTGFAFDVELLAHAQRDGYRLIELPVQWTDCEGSTFRPVVDGIRTARELLAAHRALRAPAF